MDKSTQTVSLSKKKEHIVITEVAYDELGFGGETRRGIVPIAPDRDPDEMLEIAQSFEWTLGDEADLNGFYAPKRGKKATEVEQES